VLLEMCVSKVDRNVPGRLGGCQSDVRNESVKRDDWKKRRAVVIDREFDNDGREENMMALCCLRS
jgi:hypothetical protein